MKVATCPKTGKPHRWREPFKRKHNKHINYRIVNGNTVYFHVYQCADCERFKTVKDIR